VHDWPGGTEGKGDSGGGQSGTISHPPLSEPDYEACFEPWHETNDLHGAREVWRKSPSKGDAVAVENFSRMRETAQFEESDGSGSV
jgi:hypothetical protein